MRRPRCSATHVLLAAVAALAVISPPLPASGAGGMISSGQTLYVPVYSHILFGDRAAQFNLAASLSIRNVDPAHPISISAVDYYDSAGRLVKKHAGRTIQLGPLASTEFFIPERDTTGGLGAAFIVSWSSEKPVNAPLVETVMIGAQHGLGISFVGRARVIEERPK